MQITAFRRYTRNGDLVLMSSSFSSKTNVSPLVIGGTVGLGILGLVAASISLAYIAGMFGLSYQFASQVVAAISVGGWVLAVVMAAISGGIAGVVIATARWAIARWGKNVAIA
jgi:hypothetical protein